MQIGAADPAASNATFFSMAAVYLLLTLALYGGVQKHVSILMLMEYSLTEYIYYR